MHKLLKASIAGAAGIALLAGGAGTFAIWQDSASISSTSIQSGELRLAKVANSGTWSSSISGAISNISTHKIVPGEKLTFTQDLTVTAVGTNLKAELSYNHDAFTGITNGVSAPTLDVTSGTPATVTRKAGEQVFTVTPSASSTTVTAKLTVDFAQAATGGQATTLSIPAVTFTLKQIANAV